MHSPDGPSTGSFCHGVRRYELFDAHVAPDPVSLMRQPLTGFPITLIHGAGGRESPTRRISYSPLSLKPPIPLKCVSPSPLTVIAVLSCVRGSAGLAVACAPTGMCTGTGSAAAPFPFAAIAALAVGSA